MNYYSTHDLRLNLCLNSFLENQKKKFSLQIHSCKYRFLHLGLLIWYVLVKILILEVKGSGKVCIIFA